MMDINEGEANEIPNTGGPVTGEGHQLNDPPPLEGDNETEGNTNVLWHSFKST